MVLTEVELFVQTPAVSAGNEGPCRRTAFALSMRLPLLGDQVGLETQHVQFIYNVAVV
jgi:hypothetical protein